MKKKGKKRRWIRKAIVGCSVRGHSEGKQQQKKIYQTESLATRWLSQGRGVLMEMGIKVNKMYFIAIALAQACHFVEWSQKMEWSDRKLLVASLPWSWRGELPRPFFWKSTFQKIKSYSSSLFLLHSVLMFNFFQREPS